MFKYYMRERSLDARLVPYFVWSDEQPTLHYYGVVGLSVPVEEFGCADDFGLAPYEDDLIEIEAEARAVFDADLGDVS